MSYGAFATRPAFNAGRVVIPPPTRAGLGSSSPDYPLWVLATGTEAPYSLMQGSAPPAPTAGVYKQSTQDDLNLALEAAQQSGVDPAAINKLYATGADPVQLMLAATGGVGSATMQSEMDTINTDVGASNYPASGAATGSTLAPTPLGPATSTDWSTWIQSNIWWIAGGVLAVVLIPPILRKL